MRWQQRDELDQNVAQAYNARKGRSGAPRLCHDLREAGLPCNRKTVAASMQRQGLRAKAARKFKATTNSRHSLPVAENLLKQDFKASAPNQKWVGDITYRLYQQDRRAVVWLALPLSRLTHRRTDSLEQVLGRFEDHTAAAIAGVFFSPVSSPQSTSSHARSKRYSCNCSCSRCQSLRNVRQSST